MFAQVVTAGIHGMESYLAHVEVDASPGMPGFDMVGMLSTETKEAKERVRVALKNSEIKLPPEHITVNIAPAGIRKEGTAYDLPIAVGIMVSLGYIPQEYTDGILFVGELGLNGELKPVKGILPIVSGAVKDGIRMCILPKDNALEGAVIQNIQVVGMETFMELTEYLNAGEKQRECLAKPVKVDIDALFERDLKEDRLDFSDINGQETVKRAACVAAAGFHHLLISGPPGAGKTMIAKRLSGILPPLTRDESMEVTTIYSISGMLPQGQALITRRPFLNPHHTISEQALAGGGRVPMPGVLSLSHRGILFLDELPEFSRSTIEVMRQPLEDKKVCIARTMANYTYPADFILVAAMNPCPCGYYPDRNRCKCSANDIRRYRSRVSGPILDRIDISIEAPPVDIRELEGGDANESSEQIRSKVLKARQMQKKRFEGTQLLFNADMGSNDVKKYCNLALPEQQYMEQVFHSMRLSARAYHKTLKVARTIADLDGADSIQKIHLNEAVCYRMNEKEDSIWE